MLTGGVLIAAVAGSFPVWAARATDTTIGFDDLPSGTTISNQYLSKGVSFGLNQAGLPEGNQPRAIAVAPGVARSDGQVAFISTGGEVSSANVWCDFTTARKHVSFYVGATHDSSPTLTVTAFDGSGAQVAQQSPVITTTNMTTFVDVSTGTPDIVYVQLKVASDPGGVAIDDLTYDVPSSPPPPDFGVAPIIIQGGPTLTQGGSGTVDITIHRYNGSTGPISLAASGLPQGVTAGFSPNPTSGGEGSKVTMTLTAAGNAPPAVSVPVTITGTPQSSNAGSQSHTATVPVSVSGNFDLRAQGIEVTQGVQSNGLLIPSGAGSGGSYRGVDLVDGTKTVVRFYADAHGAPPGGVPSALAVLHGFRNGVELPFSPINPDYGPAKLGDTGEPDPPAVFPAERTSDNNAFTFTLPDSWTSGTIQLQATVLPPFPSFNGPQFTECPAPACQSNNTFVLNDVTFTRTPTVYVTPIEIRTPSEAALPDPAAVFAAERAVEPGGVRFVVAPYGDVQDPTTIIDNFNNDTTCTDPKADADKKKNDPTCDKNQQYFNLVNDWAGANGSNADIVVGVNRIERGAASWGIWNQPLDNPAQGSTAHIGVALVNIGRPLTSVGHEMGHEMGRNHADEPGNVGCGGNGGPWPPDQRGFIEGIGLDTRKSPYRIIAPGLAGQPAQWYDFMSYCVGSNESAAWISDRGWVHDVDALVKFGQRSGRLLIALSGLHAARLTAHRERTSAMSDLYVSGLAELGGGVTIGTVSPTTRAPESGFAGSPFRLVSRDATGRVLSDVPMIADLTHEDPGPYFTPLEARIPARGVQSIEFVADGAVVAKRRRSAHVPKVEVISPQAGQVVGHRRSVAVSWRAGDRDGDPLRIAVDYSADSGRSWRTVYTGPNRGSINLPSRFFAGSPHARIRIDANDGFNEGHAVSGIFAAVGSPPIVSILTPRSGQTFAGAATVSLRGQAFDDALRPLRTTSLGWFEGRIRLGTGEAITLYGLPAGDHRIRLVARDARARTATASVLVHVTPVGLGFLDLKAPTHVSRSAKTVVLHASAALPAILLYGHRSFQLGRNPVAVAVPIVPGPGPVELRLSVRANGVTLPINLAVRR